MQVRLRAHSWGLMPAFVAVLMCTFAIPAFAQPKKKAPPPAAAAPAEKAEKPDATVAKESGKKGDKVKNFDFNGMDLNGRMRTPQLLYFLERANEELERASLEKRSFIPHMVKSVEEESL